MGNIQGMTRGDGGSAKTLAYAYTGNQLQTATFSDNSDNRSYGYDGNGNATSDGKGHAINYNLLNLPDSILIPSQTLKYVYDATGKKLRKISNGSVTEYIDGIQYKPDGTIDFIQTEEGRALNSSGTYNYEYALKDHLGNNRASFDQTTGLVQEDDYYPFGLNQHLLQNAANKYLYNGKELQEELNQYDYGARFYDPVIARWNTIDLMAEKFLNYSPYNYAAGNPISLIDPNGKDISEINGGLHFDNNNTEDAKNAFLILTGQRSNLYVDVEGDEKKRNTENSAPDGWSGQWAVLATKNLHTATAAINIFKNKSISNLVLETHGKASEIRIDDLDESKPENNTASHFISTNDLASFKDNQSEKVSDLKSITDKIADHGRFILAACSIGVGDDGKAFGTALNNLTGGRFSIFLPNGLISTPTQFLPAHGVILGMQQPNFFEVTSGVGWLTVSEKGQFSSLRSISISPYPNTPPIKLTK